MPRRILLSVQDIYRRRAASWEEHYQRRNLVSATVANGMDAIKVIRVINKNLPNPMIEIDGYLYRPLDVIKGEALSAYELGIPQESKHLMCQWYWSVTQWDEFVFLYQGLPDITDRYYLQYDAERDGARLVPVSSKKSRSDARYNLGTSQVQVAEQEDKNKYKSGTSDVQVQEIRYKSEVNT